MPSPLAADFGWALLQFGGRVLLGFGIILLVLASHAWWGNPDSLLGSLAWPGVACLAGAAAAVAAQRVLLARRRAARRSKP